jgi:hypothetical protein
MANDQQVGVGSSANDGTGDTIRAAFQKYNAHEHPGAHDLNGDRLTIDADADSYLEETSDDLLDLFVGGERVGRWQNDGSIASKFEVRANEADANSGPAIVTYRDSASPAAADRLGTFRFDGEDDAGNQIIYARLVGEIVPDRRRGRRPDQLRGHDRWHADRGGERMGRGRAVEARGSERRHQGRARTPTAESAPRRDTYGALAKNAAAISGA